MATTVTLFGSTMSSVALVPDVTVSQLIPTPPNPPASLTADTITADSARLTWLPATDFDGTVVGYRVYEVVGGVDTLVASPTASPQAITGRSSGTSYTYRVKSVDNDGLLSDAESVSFSTTQVTDVDPPTIPTAQATTGITSTGFTLNWGASTDTGSGVELYEIFEAAFSGSIVYGTVPVGTHTYTVTGKTANTLYPMRVRAKDVAGNWSSPVAIPVTTSTSADTTAPTWPSAAAITTSSVSTSSVTLTWPAASDAVGVTEYRVFQTIAGVDTQIATVTPPTVTYTVGSLSAGTAYTFKVRARDAAGNASAWLTVTVTTSIPADTTAPTKPGDPTYTNITSSGATISWTTSTDEGSGMAGHVIYSYDGTDETEIATVTPATTLSYNITGLSPDTDYRFRVKGKDVVGNLSQPSGGLVHTAEQTSSSSGLAGSMGFITGDAGDPAMLDLIIDHLNTRRNYLRGTTNQTHKMKSVRLSLQWQTWENTEGTRAIGTGKKAMIDAVIADGMVPFLGSWFVPWWAQRRDVLGMNMTGQAVTSVPTTPNPTTGTFVKFPNGVAKGNFEGITVSGAGVPMGSNRDGSDCWEFTGTGTITIGTAKYLPVVKRTAAAGAFVAQGSTSTFQVGGTNSDRDQKLLVAPSKYEAMYASFKWLAERWPSITTQIGFELSNEGNHVPYSRPRAYPEMFARQCMYAYAGIIAGSGSNYAARMVMPCSCAYRDDSDSTAFTYGDWDSGPNWLSPTTYYSRWLDEMKRLVAGTASGYSGTWEDLRSDLPDGGDISVKTHPNIFFKDYSTHAYTQYRTGSSAGADNHIYPGDAAAANFNDTGVQIHNLGWNKHSGSAQTVLGNMLVHYTENGPGMGEPTNSGLATDLFGGLKAEIGVGFTGTNTRILATSDPNGTKKRNISHPHEAFVYMWKVYRYMRGIDAWPSSITWACGSNRMGCYHLFRGFGTIADDPPHQITACYVQPASPWSIRWMPPTSTPVPDRTAPLDTYYPGVKGFSPFDAIAQAD